MSARWGRDGRKIHDDVIGVWDARQVQRKPFPLYDAMPAPLREVTLNVMWSQERLCRLDLPVERVAVEELGWQLSLPRWSFEGAPFAISPEQVRSDPDRYHVQYARTMAADLTFPAHALLRTDGVLTLLDGVHRLLKADVLGQQTIEIRKVPTTCLDTIAAS